MEEVWAEYVTGKLLKATKRWQQEAKMTPFGVRRRTRCHRDYVGIPVHALKSTLEESVTKKVMFGPKNEYHP